MTNEKILGMLNSGEIEELKKLLQHEIYKKSLDRRSGEDKRFKAMLNYFKLTKSQASPCLRYPYKKEIKGTIYSCFTDGYSVVISKEDIGDMEVYDDTKGVYPDLDKFFGAGGKITGEKFNVNKIFAYAKVLGYRLNKSSVLGDKVFVFEYRNLYFNLGLFDKAFKIIDNGEDATVLLTDAEHYNLLIVENDIGKCIILPIWQANENCHNVIHFEEIMQKGM